jgi:hypothetical protein
MLPLHDVTTVVAAAVAAALVGASAAAAAFSKSASAGPQPLSSATLAAPTGTAAANGTCIRNVLVSVDVTWTATGSAFADGYEILRATASTGPYAVVGGVFGHGTTSFTDWTTAFARTYWYRVRAMKTAWRSADSAAASVRTLDRNCR